MRMEVKSVLNYGDTCDIKKKEIITIVMKQRHQEQKKKYFMIVHECKLNMIFSPINKYLQKNN